MRPYKLRSRVEVGVVHKRTLTAKSRECFLYEYCSPVTGNGGTRQIAEKLLVQLKTNNEEKLSHVQVFLSYST
jgi:hypothetical protein